MVLRTVQIFASIALVLFGLISAYALFVGLTFGFSLWNFDNMRPTWLWLGVVAAPLPIATALKKRRGSAPILLASVIAAGALLTPYLLAVISR